MTSLPQHILVLFSCCCCCFAALSASHPLRFSSYHYPRDSLISWTSLSHHAGQENSGARMSIESSGREREKDRGEAPALLFKISGTHRKKERRHMLGKKGKRSKKGCHHQPHWTPSVICILARLIITLLPLHHHYLSSVN